MKIYVLIVTCTLLLNHYLSNRFATDPIVASSFVLNGQKQPIHVKELPMTFDYAENVPESFIPQFEAAAKDLNKNLGVEAIRLSGKRVKSNFKESIADQRNVIMWVDEIVQNSVLKDNEQARTSSFWRGDAIVEADIKFNAYQADNFVRIDFNSLARHEFAHSLGFCHHAEVSDLMGTLLFENTVKGPLDPTMLKAFQIVYKVNKIEIASSQNEESK